MLTAQQQLAVDTVDHNVLVAAGAGSGKTHVLIERYVEILKRNDEAGLNSIIAVTYTRKAASEMRSRLKAKFLALSTDPVEIEQGRQQKWLTCLNEVDGAKIGTIHSLCESIVRNHPAECGVDPQFEVIDELIQNELIEVCITKAIQDVIEASFKPQDSISLEERCQIQLLEGYAIEDIIGTLTGLIKSSMQFRESLRMLGLDPDLPVSYEGKQVIASLERIALDTIATIKRRAVQVLACDEHFIDLARQLRGADFCDQKNKIYPMIQDALTACDAIISGGTASAARDDLDYFSLLTPILAINLKSGGNAPEVKVVKDILRDLRDLVKERVDKIPQGLNALDEQGFYMVLAYIQFFRQVYALHQKAKLDQAYLDYNDLIELALKALGEDDGADFPSSVRRNYHERLRALLIDEFQDTNDLQARLLSKLAGPNTRVFLIGDDKQSIYRFQGADVSTFNKWREMFIRKDAGLAGDYVTTKLTRSFRSHPQVVSFVNALFASMLNGNPQVVPYVAAFEPLEAAKEVMVDTSDSNVHFEWIDTAVIEPEEPRSLKEYEARHVTRYIQEMVANGATIQEKNGKERPISYGDVAILVAANKDFAAFEKVFAASGVPYVTFGGTGFLSRQEILDFECLLKVLENPHDDHSLFGVLRSPFFAITDDALQSLSLKQGTLSLWQTCLEATGEQNAFHFLLNPAIRLLKVLIADANLLSLGDLMQKVIDLTGYQIAILAAPDGRQRSANVMKLVHLANQNENLSCGDFARRLSRMREYKMKESQAPLDATDAVKIMTIHASKGLEFAQVILPCLNNAPPPIRSRLLSHPQIGIAFDTHRTSGATGGKSNDEDHPAWYRAVNYLEKEMAAEERKRLLYVAMTRARDRLAVFFTQGVKGKVVKSSYREQISRLLGLNHAEMHLPAPGESILVSASSKVSFTLKTATGLVVGVDSLPAPGSSDLRIQKSEDSEIDLSLIEPLDFEPVLDSLSERDTMSIRVTPAPDQAQAEFARLDATLIGTFFHALMENLDYDLPPDKAYVEDIASALLSGGISGGARHQLYQMSHPVRLEHLTTEGLRLLEIFDTSPLHGMLQNASQIWHEQPYIIFGATPSGNRERRPDLIFLDEHGQWHIVDYKIDRVDEQSIQVRSQGHHTEQLMQYKRDLERLSGLRFVVELYFAQIGRLYAVGDDLASDLV